MAFLSELNFASNQVSDISPLFRLIRLRTLEFSDNEVKDLSPLSGMNIFLAQLGFAGNQVEDISVLAGLAQLSDLNAHTNHIAEIGALKDLKFLTKVNLFRNPLNPATAQAVVRELERRGVQVNF
jgi:Leucine-rich repeat (LRR) protein